MLFVGLCNVLSRLCNIGQLYINYHVTLNDITGVVLKCG